MSNKINPKHYQTKVKGVDIQAVDVIEAFHPQDAHISQALKYLLRAGKKPDSSYVEDVNKALWWCGKAVQFHGGRVEMPYDLVVDVQKLTPHQKSGGKKKK